MNYSNSEVVKAFAMFGVTPETRSEREIYELQRNFGRSLQDDKEERKSSTYSTGTISNEINKDSHDAQLERHFK